MNWTPEMVQALLSVVREEFDDSLEQAAPKALLNKLQLHYSSQFAGVTYNQLKSKRQKLLVCLASSEWALGRHAGVGAMMDPPL